MLHLQTNRMPARIYKLFWRHGINDGPNGNARGVL